MPIEALSIGLGAFVIGLYLGLRGGAAHYKHQLADAGKLIVATDEWDKLQSTLRECERQVRAVKHNVRGVS